MLTGPLDDPIAGFAQEGNRAATREKINGIGNCCIVEYDSRPPYPPGRILPWESVALVISNCKKK
jgi:hypothetical protein